MARITAGPAKPASSAPAASIIREVRDPLATIRAGAEVLVRSGLTELQIQRIARNVQEASIRMQELLEEFQDQNGVMVETCALRSS
jgi:hypothetical protein